MTEEEEKRVQGWNWCVKYINSNVKTDKDKEMFKKIRSRFDFTNSELQTKFNHRFFCLELNCERYFFSKGASVNHYKTHIAVKNDKAITCEYCNKRLSFPSAKSRHKKICKKNPEYKKN